jgi:hypothetical protein
MQRNRLLPIYLSLLTFSLQACQAVQPSVPQEGLPSQEVLTPSACQLLVSGDLTIYQRPSLQADIFGTASAGDQYTPEAATEDGWIGFDPGVAQAANVGIFRFRWVQAEGPFVLQGNCDDLPVVEGPPVGVCFTMAMFQVKIYSQPVAPWQVIAVMQPGDYAAVISVNKFGWYGLDLTMSSLGTTAVPKGWMDPQDANFNGPCDQFMPPSQ